ncbi:STAS domain-containing protein [Candidatus Pelagibacter sp.]|nr:STAS domain-containing protein [Candidatus Pelagibacter sp.]|tara:strand:- start:290 stop:574 length:285 start_codon:yes stop_codon:yes gene_type:complete
MKFKVTEKENISTVFLNGEIDMDIADNVREVIFPLIDAGKEVHLNLKGVQYMDSSGISVIVESNQRAKEKNTKVELKELSQPVEKVLAMARKFL